MPRICGLSAPFPGAKRPLEEGAKLGMWEFALIDSPRVDIPPANIYILAAWHPVYSQILDVLDDSRRIGVLWTSSVGEMDFTPVEQEYLNWLLKYSRVEFIWFGDPALARIYPEKGFYAPYPIDVDSVKPPGLEKKDIITLFCPTGPKKNILNQLLAVKIIQREGLDVVLHTNIQGYSELLNSLNCVWHNWLPDVEYQELIASAKVNLACSWCETFNYQVAEAALLGTISVVSPTVPIPGLVVNTPNNPVIIAEKILEGIGGYLLGNTLAATGAQLKIRTQEAQRILEEKLS